MAKLYAVCHIRMVSKRNDQPTRLTFTGVGGVTLAGDRWGPDDAPLVPMLHGGGQTRHSWKSTGTRLGAGGLRVVALDARGHGDSDWAPDGDYSRHTMARDVVAVLRQLGGPAVLVGASMGGLTSLIVDTLVEPGEIAGIVLVDVVPRPDIEGVTRVIDFLGAHTDGFDTLDQAADAVAAYLPHRERPATTDGLRRNLRRREDGRWYWHWDPSMLAGDDDFDSQTAELERAAIDSAVPLMLVRGRLSDVVSAEAAERFLRKVPRCELVEITGAAHTAAADDNDAFTDAVADFVVANAVRVG